MWVFPGLNAPAVLRRVDYGDPQDVAEKLAGVTLGEDTPRYSFMGIAYVHGVMNGEAVRGREAELRGVSLV